MASRDRALLCQAVLPEYVLPLPPLRAASLSTWASSTIPALFALAICASLRTNART